LKTFFREMLRGSFKSTAAKNQYSLNSISRSLKSSLSKSPSDSVPESRQSI
jgi:hypothetical protein